VSLARLVITSVTVEGRTKSEVARSYGLSRRWVQKLLARYAEEGEAAFVPRSRQPRSSRSAPRPDSKTKSSSCARPWPRGALTPVRPPSPIT
jgi:transposase